MISNRGKDMDAEVTALEGKLSTVREVKAGHDVRVVDGEDTISGKLRVIS